MATLADGLLAGFQGAQALGQQRFQNDLARERMDMMQRDQRMREEQLALQQNQDRRAAEEWGIRKQGFLNEQDVQERTLQLQDNQNFTAGLSRPFMELINADGSVNPKNLAALQEEDKDSFSFILSQNTEYLSSGGKPVNVVGIEARPSEDPNSPTMYAIEIMDDDGNTGFITDNASSDPDDPITFFTEEEVAKAFGKNYRRILDAGGANSGTFQGYQMSKATDYIRQTVEEQAGVAIGNMVAENPGRATEIEIRTAMQNLGELSDSELEEIIVTAGGDIEAIKAAAKKEYDELNPTITGGGYRTYEGASTEWNERVTNLSELQNSIPELEAAYATAREGGVPDRIKKAENALRLAKANISNNERELAKMQSALETRISNAENAFAQVQSGTISESSQNRFALRDLKNIEALREELQMMDSSIVMPNTELSSGTTSPGFTLTRESLLKAAQEAGQAYISEADQQRNAAYLRDLGVDSAQSLADKVPEEEYLAHVYAMLPAFGNAKDRTDFVQGMLNLRNRGAYDYSRGEQIDDAGSIATLNQRYNEFTFDRQKWATEQLDKNDAAVTQAVKASSEIRRLLADEDFGIDSPELIKEVNKFFRTSRNRAGTGGRLAQAFLAEEVEVAAALFGAYAKELGSDGFFEGLIRADQPIKLMDLAENLVVNEDGSKIAFATPKGSRVANLYEGEMLVADLNEVFDQPWLETLINEVRKDKNRVLNF